MLTKNDIALLKEFLATKDDIRDLKDEINGIKQELNGVKNELNKRPTKEDLRGELRNYPTKEDLKKELAKYATKEDLRQFATKEDLNDSQNNLKNYINEISDNTVSDIIEFINPLVEKIEEALAELRGQRSIAGDFEKRIQQLEKNLARIMKSA